jgi:nucleoside diphosphate kinase
VPTQAEAFYAEHRERPFFPGLVEFMASGPLVAAVLSKPGAVQEWRELIGPTNSLEARAKAPKRWGKCRQSSQQACRRAGSRLQPP